MSPTVMVIIILCSVLIIFVGLVFLTGYIFYSIAFRPRRFSVEQTKSIEEEKHHLNNMFGNNESYKSLTKEDVELLMDDDYVIHGTFIPNNDNRKIVIITHGHTYTRIGSVKYMWIYRKLGYAVFIYDNRGHGENKRVNCTMGYKEQMDLNSIIKYVYKRFGNDVYLGLHGESLGSTISCLALKENKSVNFCVMDCAFLNLDKLFTELCRKYHMPLYMKKIINLYCGKENGFSLKEVDLMPILEKNTKVPIEVMVGDEDDLIPFYHSASIYAATGSKKVIHYYEGVHHALSFEKNPQKYFSDVENFLNYIKNN